VIDMKKTESEQILEYLKHIYESINGPLPKARQSSKEPPLTKRVGALEKKVETLGSKFETLGKKVDKLDNRIEAARVELGDHIERIHSELTGRIIDLEVPGPGGRGGSGGGPGGVPLAS